MSTATGKKMAAGSGTARLPVRTRDRRPALAALAVLLILVGALGSALLVFRTGDRVDVLVAARDLPAGVQVSREDFTVARVANEGGAVVDAGAVESFVGSYTTGAVPEGAIVANRMFTISDVIPAGAQQVGITVPAPLRPSEPIATGDVVAVYQVPQAAPTGGTEGEAETLVPAARVLHVAAGGAGSDALHLTLLLPDSDVAAVVLQNANGQIALTRLPADTAPVIDRPEE